MSDKIISSPSIRGLEHGQGIAESPGPSQAHERTPKWQHWSPVQQAESEKLKSLEDKVARMERMFAEERSLRQKLESELQSVATASRDAPQTSDPAASRLSSSPAQPSSPWSCGPAGAQALVVREQRGGLEAWQDVAGVLHEKRDTRRSIESRVSSLCAQLGVEVGALAEARSQEERVTEEMVAWTFQLINRAGGASLPPSTAGSELTPSDDVGPSASVKQASHGYESVRSEMPDAERQAEGMGSRHGLKPLQGGTKSAARSHEKARLSNGGSGAAADSKEPSAVRNGPGTGEENGRVSPEETEPLASQFYRRMGSRATSGSGDESLGGQSERGRRPQADGRDAGVRETKLQDVLRQIQGLRREINEQLQSQELKPPPPGPASPRRAAEAESERGHGSAYPFHSFGVFGPPPFISFKGAAASAEPWTLALPQISVERGVHIVELERTQYNQSRGSSGNLSPLVRAPSSSQGSGVER